jgi:phosphoribosylformylglycinamidine cyclo-ligase
LPNGKQQSLTESRLTTSGGQDSRTDAYESAGVDIDSANRAVERIRLLAASTQGGEVLAGVGPFSALYELGAYKKPVLVSSTDGVGTKVLLARVLGRYDTIGQDLVNHCVNDILTSGAKPLFFLDYLAGSGVDEDTKVAIVAGMGAACQATGCALVGGETADMPGVYTDGDFDIAGFIVGVVERDAVIDGRSIHPGHVLLGLPSNGLHTNGYSLVRRLWGIDTRGDPERAREVLGETVAELGETLADALMRPHPSYFHELAPALDLLHGIAHITGGGLIENVPRILSPEMAARFNPHLWTPPPIFDLIRQRGDLPDAEMYRAFNMGLGIVVVVPEASVDEVRRRAPSLRVVGAIEAQRPGSPRVLID